MFFLNVNEAVHFNERIRVIGLVSRERSIKKYGVFIAFN